VIGSPGQQPRLPVLVLDVVSRFDLAIRLANLCQQLTEFFCGHGSPGFSVPHSSVNGGEGLLVFIIDGGSGVL